MPSNGAKLRLEPPQRTDLRILILNWRCPRHPRAGGAEFLTYEIARRLVAQGHAVEWFSASFPLAPNVEELEGIRIVRAGRQWSVHWRAFIRYRRTIRSRFDVVIDEVNTMPFFTPLWARIPALMLIYQLAREVWWYESSLPISALGYAIEPIYLRVYRHTPVVTISRSTKEDLQSLGFRGPISVIPVGIETLGPTANAKATVPTFLYVGRLAPSKRIGHLLEALVKFREVTGAGRLWLAGVGSAEYTKSLADMTRRLNIEESVTFWGRVSGEEKRRLMTEAHLLLMTSVREGWGLVVTEAGCCGTPAVVYDVPGLRDSVRNESTGLVVPPQPNSLADAMTRIMGDHQLYRRLANEAIQWSRSFSLDEAAQRMALAIQESLVA